MPNLLKSWLPVAVWLCFIAIESTPFMGADHTSVFLAHLLAWAHVHVTAAGLDTINHVLRKSGHFLGYGILGILFFRAFLRTLRPPLMGRPFVSRALALALFCTCLVASADEFHQSRMPSRTGSPRDVALDTTGAAVLTALAYPRFRRLRVSD